ncbi:tol-Pal system protein TolA-like [Topomyia yanbarensis]|uniref:tol-Pal system protein TolA-like n=1 Tax=Topomyia yanbarensis TaxID=2498891 RepID=UPI00273B68D9|nr:tol-Pal system protein TolA-like [Topomyia yanbarensis]XP_058822076.1 tol-Pal system protein TolA-like [Topomyia yanbarensis]
MKVTLAAVLLICISMIEGRTKAEKRKDYEFDYDAAATGAQYGGSYSPKSGYSAGSGLRSIAQGSADQAGSAVANQHAAAKQAAYVAQNTLAQAAAQAAATAQAALHGKQVLLQGLEQQSLEAHQALDAEIQQLQQAKRSAKAAQHAAQQALNHVQVLTAALNNAQVASEHAQQAASEAAAELASQTQMVGAAKSRVESIEEQLNAARVDFEATQEAAHKASASAQEAQNNAAEAAAHAALTHRTGVVDHQLQAKSFKTQNAHQNGDDINSAENEAPSNHKYNDFKPSQQGYNYPGY